MYKHHAAGPAGPAAWYFVILFFGLFPDVLESALTERLGDHVLEGATTPIGQILYTTPWSKSLGKSNVEIHKGNVFIVKLV